MFLFSSKTQVDKKFRLSELCRMIGADREIKADAANILSVTLTNVLSEETLRIPPGERVKEIYLFEIELSEQRIPALFLSALDRAVFLHTVFVLRCETRQIWYGCYKERTEKGVKLGKYYATDWADENIPIALPLETASLDDVYTALLDILIPIAARPDESTEDLVARYDRINKLKKEIEKLQRQVDRERQAKRRFELNGRLKALKQEYDHMTEGENHGKT